LPIRHFLLQPIFFLHLHTRLTKAPKTPLIRNRSSVFDSGDKQAAGIRLADSGRLNTGRVGSSFQIRLPEAGGNLTLLLRKHFIVYYQVFKEDLRY
jgi:hypothetical protein